MCSVIPDDNFFHSCLAHFVKRWKKKKKIKAFVVTAFYIKNQLREPYTLIGESSVLLGYLYC